MVRNGARVDQLQVTQPAWSRCADVVAGLLHSARVGVDGAVDDVSVGL